MWPFFGAINHPHEQMGGKNLINPPKLEFYGIGFATGPHQT